MRLAARVKRLVVEVGEVSLARESEWEWWVTRWVEEWEEASRREWVMGVESQEAREGREERVGTK